MATPLVSAATIPKKTVKDFKFIKEIGNGSYSTVFLAIETATNREFAIKAVSKELISRLKKVPEVFREKEILARLTNCPYANNLYCTFQNEKTLYFGLTYCPNGDLLQYITDAGHFPENVTRFYAAELVEALEQLHARHIIHRDLKPENILLTDAMHVQLTDFGSGLIVDPPATSTSNDQQNGGEENRPLQRKNSFVGTAQFVAPEILQCGPVNVGSDLWSLGCVIYQMETSPNDADEFSHEYDIINAVVRVAYKLPKDFPDLIGDLIQKLVLFEPGDRLGSAETGGMDRLKAHAFFSEHPTEIEWGALLNRLSPLEAKPKLSSRPKTDSTEQSARAQNDQ